MNHVFLLIACFQILQVNCFLKLTLPGRAMIKFTDRRIQILLELLEVPQTAIQVTMSSDSLRFLETTVLLEKGQTRKSLLVEPAGDFSQPKDIKIIAKADGYEAKEFLIPAEARLPITCDLDKAPNGLFTAAGVYPLLSTIVFNTVMHGEFEQSGFLNGMQQIAIGHMKSLVVVKKGVRETKGFLGITIRTTILELEVKSNAFPYIRVSQQTDNEIVLALASAVKGGTVVEYGSIVTINLEVLVFKRLKAVFRLYSAYAGRSGGVCLKANERLGLGIFRIIPSFLTEPIAAISYADSLFSKTEFGAGRTVPQAF